MRAYAVFIFCVVALTLPTSAYAAFTPLPIKNTVSCTAQNAGNLSGTEEFKAAESEKLKNHIQRVVQCPSACFDEYIAVTVDIGLLTDTTVTVKTLATNKCTKTEADPKAEDAKKDTRGCAKGETQPSIIVDVPAITGITKGKRIGPKSRCDANVTGVTDQMFSRIQSGDAEGFRSDIAALDALPQTVAPLSVGSVNGNEALVNAFKAAGVSESDARAAIDRNPVAAADFINAISTGDTAKAEASKETLGLNTNLSDVDRMAVQRAAEEALPARESEDPNAAQNTFNPPQQVTDLDRAKCAISRIESGSCGGNYGLIGPLTQRGQRAYGRYQVMDFNIPSWTYGACGQALNPYQFLASGECQERVFEKYFGQGIQTCGSYEGAALRWFSGRCYDSGSNDGYTSTTRYLQKFLAGFNSTTLPFGAQASIYTGGSGSPFAQVNPFYSQADSGGYYGSPFGASAPVGYASPPMPPSYQTSYATQYTQSSQQYPSQNQVPQTGQTSPQPTAPTSTPTVLPPVATIIAQPREVIKGDNVAVSWSTIGMSTERPCQVFSDNSFLAQGNEGTRSFPTQPINSGTTVTFKLKCFTLAGQAIEQGASIRIK